MSAMRNEENEVVHNAHILGSLRRILRLMANKVVARAPKVSASMYVLVV